jgi:uncharacterized protein YfbU (UPF0304 family)
MAQLNVRLDDHIRDALDALAKGRGVTASDLMRGLIDGALGRSADEPPADPTPRSLSSVQRRALALQHETLALLTSDSAEEDGGWEAQHHRNMAKVFEEGFVAEYGNAFAAMQPELPRNECQLLHDILDMFRTIEPSLAALSPEDRAALDSDFEHALMFRGLDYNDDREARLATYAEYLVSTDRWTERAGEFGGLPGTGNSHTRMLDTYQQMLSVWRPLWLEKTRNVGGGLLFSVVELAEIAAA